MVQGVSGTSGQLLFRDGNEFRSQKGALSPEQQREVRQLQAIDRKVRAHEQAHVSAGGSLVRGGATFTYATGPDEKRYAVGGEVSIDTSPGRTPEETIPKAQHIRRTALAPADPSPQDRSVAGQATRMEGEARRQLATAQADESSSGSSGNPVGLAAYGERSLDPLRVSIDVFA